ncbi:MAG TPA: PKD domain-containing protein [Mycobacteriales bacterium]
MAAVAAALAGSPAWAVNAQQDKVVSAVPSAATPNAVGGATFSMAQVGTTIVMGGAFTSIQSPDRATTYNLPYLAAFDQATGQVNTAFAPGLDGTVNAVLPGPTPGTVYVGGAFNNIGGVRAKGLVLLDVSNGSRVAGFGTLPMNGIVNTIARTGSRLFVGGTFTQIGGQTRGGIASMGATTGVVDSFMTSTVTVNHNWTPTNGGAKAGVGVSKIDITRDGGRLVAIGNFTFVDGLLRDQVAMWNLGAAAELRSDWQTHRYEPACFSWAYDSYIRDVDFSPDGSYFVIAATGGGNGTLCDTAARFETNASGTDIQPTWVDYAGGDTVLSIAITGTAVYAGGHMRWMNNPNASDFAGRGSVPRPGLVALDPANGMPLSWNPGRNPRGAGAYSLLATAQGLYVGSDTDFIGNRKYFRGKIAFFPLAPGAVPASTAVQALPGGAYLGGAQNGATNVLYRANAGGGAIQSTDAGPDWSDGSANVSGGNTAGWSPVPAVDATVPASTPRSIFDSERWGAQSWAFPIPSGATVKVRLYYANRCTCTSGVGQRVFTVAINGTTVQSGYDIVADVGDQTGTMKEFPNLTAAADGAVHVDFTNQVENPLINGIEIIRTDVPEPPPGAAGGLVERNVDGSTAGAPNTVSSPLDFTAVRGATLVGDQLYYGRTDGLFYRRTFDGTTFGAEQLVDPYNDPAWSNVDTGSGQTFRGARPSFYTEIVNITAMFTDGSGQLYYKLLGDPNLYKRAFSADSGIVHDDRIATGTQLPDVTGAFYAGGNLYYATRADGNLTKVAFSAGTVSGSPTVVSGPSVDGVEWRARALFFGPRIAANDPPTAVASVACSGLTCTAGSAGSGDPDGSIAAYSWAWGDGATSTGSSASHTYASGGSYTVTLTVTDNDGASATATKPVTVTAPPPVTDPITFRATAGNQANATSAKVTVPASVQAGDRMVLVMTSNSSAVTYGDPAGWTLVDAGSTTGVSTRIYSRSATAADAGSAVTVTASAVNKMDLRLAAYANAGAISVHALAFDTAATASHTTPTVTVTGTDSWVLSYWADKSSSTTAWSAPAGQTVRGTTIGTGTGRVTSLLTDANGPAAAGPAGGLSASTDAAGTKATMVTLVLAPAG